ncbi:peptidoglycan D,D-transpeptidase FtsI family protein [Zafaria sp. Z1313]|uniref:peptidoglycan D,D-transpeptidase FtsI family protein n=1 Tax=unclassified Zafaria TaxID=2828765 RepID=UPI002E7A22E1|nr:penicillin-binding protein 2 [Zafaria sp. J156]MEE1620294.1 penicillin-binding protein 2 [Zafaria sp. J156]
MARTTPRGSVKTAQDPSTGTRRLRAGLAIVLALMVLVGGRLFFVQGLDPQAYAQAALDNRLKTQPIAPVRGDILDSQGRVLATSVVRYDLVADQKFVKDVFARKNAEDGTREEVALEDGIAELAAVLGRDADSLTAAIVPADPAKPKRYSYVAKGVTPEVRNAAMKIGLPGLVSEQHSERNYPNGSVAGPIIGFLSAENKAETGIESGAEGLELSQESHLAGTAGSRTFEVGADGVRIPMATLEEIPAVDGQDVRLTINNDIQWAAQEAVMAKRNQFNAQWVNAVALDMKTGRILALADSTSVDPSDPGATDAQFRTSTTVTQAFEPGSTGKLATFAAALEEGVVTPEEEFSVPNSYTVQKETINDSLKHATYPMTAAGIFARSYNTGTVMVGERLTNEQRYEWFKKFGIGSKLDIGLPSNKGIFVPPAAWDRRQQFTTMFGQAYTQTALHTAKIFSTIGNHGLQVEPRLIDAYIDPDGTEHPVEEAEPRRVVSEETSEQMRRMMETVVLEGTAQGAAIEGYRVGGKTGTGQAASPTGGYDGHTSSFAGMVPIDDPQYLVVVTMHRPQGNWRSWGVQDTFKSIMSQVLNTYNVPPSTTEPEGYKVFVGDQQKYSWE